MLEDDGIYSQAEERLHVFRCTLNKRGIGAAPVDNSQARSAPPEPGSCLEQRRRLNG